MPSKLASFEMSRLSDHGEAAVIQTLLRE